MEIAIGLVASLCCVAGIVLALVVVVGLFFLGRGGGHDDPLQELASLLNESRFVDHGEDGRDMTEDERAIVNALGRKVAFGDPDQVVDEASKHLDGATGLFRESLLNQRGGAHFMAGRYEQARDDYQAAVDGNPDDRSLLGNLAEAEAKLGNRAAVYALVDRFLELGGELDAARVTELKQAVETAE